MSRFLKRLPYILCCIVAFALGVKQLREPDVWWQLLAGRWMLEQGEITRTDVFSFTMAGHPWVNVKWLYEIIIALLEKAAGPEGVILLQAVVNVVIIHILFRTMKLLGKELQQPVSDFAAALSALLFLAMVEYRMAGRPEMVSHLLSTIYLYILWRHPQMELKRLWWLILLQCIWANMHEGYPVGLVIIGTAVAGSLVAYICTKQKSYLQQCRNALIILGAAAIAILANPNTIQLWKQPFEIYRQVWANKYTTELYSVANPAYWTIQAKWHIVLLVLVCIFWIMRFIVGRKGRKNNILLTPIVLTYLLLIPLFGYLSLTANRNIPFAQIILAPSVAYMLIWTVSQLKLENNKMFLLLSRNAILFIFIIAATFYVSIVTNKFYEYTKSPNRFGAHISTLHNPTGVASFIKQNDIKGPMFSDYFVSSYMLWDLYPDFKSYIDLRDLDVFPVSFFEDYFSIYNDPDKFDSLNKKYNFNYIVFSNSQLNSLQQKLYWGNDYNLIYADPVSSLYLKNTAANEIVNRKPELLKLFNWPRPSEDPAWAFIVTKVLNPSFEYEEEDEKHMAIYGARYYNAIQSYVAASKVLLPFLITVEDDPNAFNTIAKSFIGIANKINDPAEINRKLDSAGYFLQRALDLDPNMATVYVSMADINMMRSDFRSAKDNYQTAIRLDDSKPMVHFYAGVAAYYVWKAGGDRADLKDVIKAMKACTYLEPENRRAYIYLATALTDDGKQSKAKEILVKVNTLKDPIFPEEQKMLDELNKRIQ
jgi:tetratricopeptide (TPR) repeat protein